MTFTAAPPIPDSSVSEPTFDAQWQAFNDWAANTHVDELNAALPLIESAADASAAAIAAANYKGLWSTLSGPLAIPATVVHSGTRWMLTESVADVTVEVPGVSVKWLSLTATQTYELISTTSASAAATVDWTNFDTLAATYDHLVLQASNVLGSAATATLTGQVRQSNAWQTATWSGSDIPQTLGLAALSATSQLTNVAKQAMVLQVNMRQLGVTAVRHIDFVSSGGATNATLNIGFSSFNATSYAPTTTIQGLRISASTGTISGVFRLYGARK